MSLAHHQVPGGLTDAGKPELDGCYHIVRPGATVTGSRRDGLSVGSSLPG